MDNIKYITGFFTAKNMITYTLNGVRIHKPPFENLCGESAGLVLADFTDTKTGKITDKFYGTCNDFNISFAAKASRGDRFDVTIHDFVNAPKWHVPYNEAGEKINCIFHELGTITQREDGSWKPVEYEPVGEYNGEYYLLNTNFKLFLRETGRKEEEAKIIARSRDRGEFWN